MCKHFVVFFIAVGSRLKITFYFLSKEWSEGDLKSFQNDSQIAALIPKWLLYWNLPSSVEKAVQYYLGEWQTAVVISNCCNEGLCMLDNGKTQILYGNYKFGEEGYDSNKYLYWYETFSKRLCFITFICFNVEHQI